MRKRLALVAVVLAGLAALGATLAFSGERHAVKTCAEIMADPPEGGWTCGWTGSPEISEVRQ
ncbi:hypothetical protein [Actinopolymorpha alba]|uniref:hypothetical protein n=1 Tax=Actinopolymorpha alba TaxID=533267 RepID=UPI000368C5E5|nr:hypothetical protein [Actinopolymorpha alba]